MLAWRRGTTREVLLTRRHAFKLPSARGWKLFLFGLIANMQEREFAATEWPELCPVRFALPGGFLVVMARARALSDVEWDAFDVASFLSPSHGEYTVPAEPKRCSFGVLDGEIVAVDYGN